MEILQHYQEFLNKAILQDQTALINTILENENSRKYIASIHNRNEHWVTLSDGKVVGSEELMKDLQIERKEELTALTQKIILANDYETIYSLVLRKKVVEDDLKLLYNTRSKERQVLQWLLVPYWLSDELISYGEVVLRCLDCCFWGVGCYRGKLIQRDAVLSEIFHGMNG